MKNIIKMNFNTRNKLFSLLLAFALFIGILPSDMFQANAASPSVYYRVHQQNYGDLAYAKNGASAGYTGKSLRIESMSAYISGMSGGIQFRTHQANYGWHGWSSSGWNGVKSKSLQLEAIQVKLTGEISKHYDIYYRVHMKSKGWSAWVKGPSTAGTTGESRRLESIEMKLVAKSSSSSSSSNKSARTTCSSTPVNITTGWYKVLVPGTTFAFNLQFAPASGNANAVLDSFNSEGNEIFYIENIGGNKYYIRPYYRFNEGDLALNSLYGASTKEGQQLLAHDATNKNDTASLWYLEKSGNYYRFRNVASNKYITLSGTARTGTKLILKDNNNSMNQMFTLTSVNATTPKAKSATISSVWPVGGNGGTDKKNWPKYSDGSYHSGTDISGTRGTPILATHSGTVYYTKSLTTSYGKHVVIKCNVNGKTVYIYYCHLDRIDVVQNQQVSAGQQIGTLGSTGKSTGPHLHYEVRNANMHYGSLSNPTLNPYDYLPTR